MKLAEALKIVQSTPSSNAEKFSVWLACGIFPLHLSTFLAAHLNRRIPERNTEIQSGVFGDLPGNLLQLKQSNADAGAVVIEWADLDPRLGLRRLGGWGPNVLSDVLMTAGQSANQLLQLLDEAAKSVPIAVCLPTLALPPISYQPGEQFELNQLLLEKTLHELAASAAGIANIKIINRHRLDAVSPSSGRLDVKSELSTGFPYTTVHASIVGELLASLIYPSPPKKGLITDLDDTLWRGLVGEQGVDGISWELDQRSHIHALYQQLLRALSDSGVLVAVASKNDPALVAEALARSDLILPRDSIFPVEVSWNPKSESVGKILKAWNIGADATVFVDDSPLELAEVENIYPEMECLRFLPDNEQATYALLHNLRDFFGKQEIVAEDAIRLASLRSSGVVQSEAERDTSGSFETFLEQLNPELTLSTISGAGESRAFELVNKTNQFNLNGRRLDIAQFRSALNRRDTVSLLVSYNDKFGPLGKIAVLLGRLDSTVLTIDTRVMSCRAFSRRIEHKCLEHLFESLDVSKIEMDFQPTQRNGPMQDFLSQFINTDLTARPLIIDRQHFMNTKPDLYHKINEVSYV